MKKLALVFMMFFIATGAMFAQSDLQVLAVVKVNKSESITLKQLKQRCDIYQKQLGRNLTVDEKKKILETLIDEKLVYQSAQKAGLSIPDSYIDQYFLQSISQSVGKEVTEKELTEIVKKTQNKSLDEFLIESTGMNVAEYKTYLKNQLIMQQYIVQVNKDNLQKVAPTDEEIRIAYESNKSSFVWNDMVKILLVIVEKGSDADAAKNKLTDLLNKYKDKKLTSSQISIQSQSDAAGYKAAEIIVPKNEQSANGIGMTLQNLIFVFEQGKGYLSGVQETTEDYRFLSVLEKYDAKMLGISDIVQPDTTVTVYDYIRSSLTQQKQAAFVANAAQELSTSLNTADNVEMKKTGAALDKLLAWENN